MNGTPLGASMCSPSLSLCMTVPWRLREQHMPELGQQLDWELDMVMGIGRAVHSIERL